jgi:hypothetical protein
MSFGKGKNSLWGMAFYAEFFCLFFSHFLKSTVIRILGKFGRGLSRGVEQEEKNGATGEDKGDIEKHGVSFSG